MMVKAFFSKNSYRLERSIRETTYSFHDIEDDISNIVFDCSLNPCDNGNIII